MNVQLGNRMFCLVIVFTGLLLTVSPLHAVEPENNGAAKQVVTEQTLGTDDSIMSMILSSGATGVLFMSVLGLFSIVGATVAVERAVNMRRSRIIPHEFVHELHELSHGKQPRLEEFRQLCEVSTAPIANIIRSALTRCGRPLLEIEKTMEDAAVREMAELRSRIRPLNVVGNICPLVGLLGTVVGMIIAFHTASQAGLGKAELLAKGIYMALLTTAAGLTIAIPALLLAAYFNGRAEKFFRQTDVHLMEALPCFATLKPPAAAESVPNPDDPLASVKF